MSDHRKDVATESVERAALAALSDEDAGLRLLAWTSLEGAHLEDEQIAALLEGTPSARTLAHALSCGSCRRRVEVHERLEKIVALAARRDRTATLDATERAPTMLPRAALFATLRVVEGVLEVLSTSGVTRVQPALAVRSGAGSSPSSLQAISLRDDARSPLLEIATFAGHGDRVSFVVRWLAGGAALRVAATSNGRRLADIALVEGSALLPDLRPQNLRISVHDGSTPVASAWIRFETA